MPAPSYKSNAILAVLLALATIIAYTPSLRGELLWDDPDHIVNRPVLRDLDGLRQIWTDTHSIPQWYPLVHTTFWIEHHLWGENPLGYRIINLFLHIATSLLLWKLLSELEVPGAFVAAAIFALHPVHVETVAWITERKNTLSAFFYVCAFLAYGRVHGSGFGAQEGPPKITWYLGALALFLCALLSKTVTASFPAAVLLVIWLKRGSIRWRDIAMLIPFVIAGVCFGWITKNLEREHVGALGHEWDLTSPQRVLIAGRAVWFYAAKLLVPTSLSFMYERWNPDPRVWWQWLYPITALLIPIALFKMRNRLGRGPLVAVLFFGGTLFPALGFFNVYPHRYSFVADHFQYLASIGLIVLIAAVLAREQWELSLLILIVLAGLSFHRAATFDNRIALWADATEKSPGNWVTWFNLGRELKMVGRIEEAVGAHQVAFKLNQSVPDTWYSVGNLDAMLGDLPEAERKLQHTLELAGPKSALRYDTLIRLGWCSAGLGRIDEARRRIVQAVEETRGAYRPATDALVELNRKHPTQSSTTAPVPQ